jgi:hypothetical protein
MTIRETYKIYKTTVENPVNVNTYLTIFYRFINFFVDQIMNGNIVSLPDSLGQLGILGSKITPKVEKDGTIIGLSPNWKKTKGKEKISYNFNDHTNGVRYKITWLKRNMSVYNKHLYSFKLSRTNKRKIWKNILSGKEYIISTPLLLKPMR